MNKSEEWKNVISDSEKLIERGKKDQMESFLIACIFLIFSILFKNETDVFLVWYSKAGIILSLILVGFIMVLQYHIDRITTLMNEAKRRKLA